MSEPGTVYVLFSPEMPHCLKVGHTTREAKVRASELSSNTSTPVPFRVLMAWRVTNSEAAESAAHAALKDFRLSDKREFFRIDGPEAIQIVGKAIREYLLKEVDDVILDRIEKECRSIARHYFAKDWSKCTYGDRMGPDVVPVELGMELYTRLVNRAFSLAEWMEEEGSDPSAMVAILDLVYFQMDGPVTLGKTPTEVADMIIFGIDILSDLCNVNNHFITEVSLRAASVLAFTTCVNHSLGKAISRDNKERFPEE